MVKKEKIVVITGANSGIGKAAACKFAMEGYTVVMGCRNWNVSEKVRKEIITTTRNSHVYLFELDMGSFASIRKFCSIFMEKFERLDILIHNAAYFNHGEPFRLSPDNMELTFATNVFGPFLMTSLLKEHLKRSEDARILHASSNIVKHFFDPKRRIEYEDLIGERQSTKPFKVYNMYCQSKMAFVLLTFKMAEEYKADGIKVYALQINGAKMSKETLKKFKPAWRSIAYIQNLFIPPPEKMANCYFTICTSHDFKHVTGKLINDLNEIMEPGKLDPDILTQIKQIAGRKYYPAFADNKDNLEELWDFTKQVTGVNETYKLVR